MMNGHERRTWLAEMAVAIALIGWRLAAGSPATWWKDWIIVVSAFWIFTRLKAEAPARPVVGALVMAYLLGIYLLGQAPLALFVFGIRP